MNNETVIFIIMDIDKDIKFYEFSMKELRMKYNI